MRFSYIFNQDEFKMLLALAGYKKLYGYSLENKIISADCAGYAFNNLYKEKIIIKNLNGFKIEPEVHSALKTIGEFEHYMIINSNDIFLNTLSCYIRNGRIVVCSGVTVSQNKVKISSFFCNTIYRFPFRKFIHSKIRKSNRNRKCGIGEF